jgi:serine/threonine protein kinase
MSRYLILRQLGHGNLTRVFLSTVRAPDRLELRVLKLMRNELANDDDFRALFIDQAASTLALRHPNLVRTLDVVADAEACGLTMEFLDGQTLGRVIDRVGRTRFPVDMHLHVLRKVLGALDYAHAELARAGGLQAGFLHRDVCPSNVFITYDGQVKLLGTGFADATRALEARLGRPLTDVRYAAPEVLFGQAEGPSADLFGVGTMLWEAAARQARVSGDDTALIIQRRTEGKEPELERVWPDAPLPLLEMCRRALATDPRKRYPSVAALRADLDVYLGRASQSSEAVLQRLAGSIRAQFATEREQMQLFIGSSLESASHHSMPSPDGSLGTDDELTPHDQEWSAPTSAHIRALDLGATGQIPVIPNARALDPLDSPDVAVATETRSPLTTRAPAPASALDGGAPRESSTGGHRAYSTNLEATPRRQPSKLRFSPDVLGAAALIVGSVVAAYSLYRHSTRDKQIESEQLAMQAEARTPAPSTRPRETPSSAPPPRRSQALPQPNVPTPASAAADAGSSEESQPATPAFFDGKTTARNARAAAAPLNAEDLPTVDPALSSLQDAILIHARAHQVALKHKRDRKAEAPLPSPSAGGSMPPRPTDEAKP